MKWKTIPFTIVSKTVKYKGLNLMKNMQKHYGESFLWSVIKFYKTMLWGIKQVLNTK